MTSPLSRPRRSSLPILELPVAHRRAKPRLGCLGRVNRHTAPITCPRRPDRDDRQSACLIHELVFAGCRAELRSRPDSIDHRVTTMGTQLIHAPIVALERKRASTSKGQGKDPAGIPDARAVTTRSGWGWSFLPASPAFTGGRTISSPARRGASRVVSTDSLLAQVASVFPWPCRALGFTDIARCSGSHYCGPRPSDSDRECPVDDGVRPAEVVEAHALVGDRRGHRIVIHEAPEDGR